MKNLKVFLELDKLLHLFATGWLFFVLIIVFQNYDIAIVGSIVSFIGKELYDKYIKKTYFDIKDAIISLFGLIISLVIYDIFTNKL